MTFDHVTPIKTATPRDRFEAIALSIRDVLSQRWIKTEQTYQARNVKRVYYLSLEFLMGRALANSITNLMLDPRLGRASARRTSSIRWRSSSRNPTPAWATAAWAGSPPASCDSMATLGIPGMGSGLRYEYGIFKQTIRDGWQREQPDHWLARPDPWEVRAAQRDRLKCGLAARSTSRPARCAWSATGPRRSIGVPYDRPVDRLRRAARSTRCGCGPPPRRTTSTSSSSAAATSSGALAETLTAETLTRVLYPDDSTAEGKGLRFLQQ